jgi:hypothetical protein
MLNTASVVRTAVAVTASLAFLTLGDMVSSAD